MKPDPLHLFDFNAKSKQITMSDHLDMVEQFHDNQFHIDQLVHLHYIDPATTNDSSWFKSN